MTSEFQFIRFLVPQFSLVINPKEIGELSSKVSGSAVYYKNENNYQLSLEVAITDESEALEIKAQILGLFSIAESVPEENKKVYFLHNAILLLLPHLRSYVASSTLLAGMEAVMLPSIDVGSLSETIKKNFETKQG